MNQSKILVVEDDHDIAQLLAITMKKAGFEVAVSEDGYEALNLIRRHPPDLLILDLMIPGIDGFEVCKEMKREPKTAEVPVLILTARGEEIDRIIGLELGADDYVVKPFSPRELLLRVRAILRRTGIDYHPTVGLQEIGAGNRFRRPSGPPGGAGDRSYGHGVQITGGTGKQPGQGAEPRTTAGQGVGISFRRVRPHGGHPHTPAQTKAAHLRGLDRDGAGRRISVSRLICA